MTAINRFSPKTIGRAHDELRSDYSAAKMSRFRRVRTGMLSTIGSGADYHYRIQSDFLRMMEYSRDMDRNDAVIGQAVDRAVLNTIQEGMTVDPQTGDKALNAQLRAKFDEWCEDPDLCDIAGESTFADMQWQSLRATFIDGDSIAIPTVDGSLQLTEAHRLRTPSGTRRNVIHGILMDDNRKRLEYWFTKDDVDPFRSVQLVSEVDPIAARDSEGFKQVFHVYCPKRVSQTRGVTALAPVFDVAGMLDDINFSAVVRQQVANVFALIRERSSGFQMASNTPFGTVTDEPQADGSVRQLQNVGPGMEISGAVGETLKMDGAKVPSMEFFSHVKLMLQLVGVNLGMPLILMLMDASETNFSGWRGAFDQAKLGFRHNQQWFSRKFCRPTYIWKLRQFAAADPSIRRQLEKLGRKFFDHRWNAPRWPYIQPLQDAQADGLRLEKRLTSPRRLSAEKGVEQTDLTDEIIEDNGDAITKAIIRAKKIEQETGQAVDWHECLYIQNEVIKATAAEPPTKGKPDEEKPVKPGSPSAPSKKPDQGDDEND